MISAVIAALPQEKEKLKKCIASIKNFCDEIKVFEIGTDVPFTPHVETIRNKMVESCRGDWILVLDPDERVPESLANRLKAVVSAGADDAVNIPRKNIFLGKWISHTNWWPDRHVRFFKKGAVSWSKTIHLYPKVFGKQLDLPAREDFAIEHIGYNNLAEFIDRQNRYSDVEAQNRLQRREGFSFWKLFWWPTREFLARYIRHKGFLDGIYGFILVYLMMFYKFMVVVKMWEEGR